MNRYEPAPAEAEAYIAPIPVDRDEYLAQQREVKLVMRSITRGINQGLLPLQPLNDEGTFGEEPGFYAFDPRITPQMLEGVWFEPQAEQPAGIADSAHAVTIGEWGGGAVATGPSLSVAIKCYAQKRSQEDRITRMRSEANIMDLMRDAEELAFRTIAVAVVPYPDDKNKAIAMMTHFQPERYTMDNIPWGRGLIPENRGAARAAVEALGRFHRLGWRHGDAQIKNVLAAADGPGASMIDFETSSGIELSDPVQVRGAVLEDLRFMMSSLAKKGFFRSSARDQEPHRTALAAIDDLCASYFDGWSSHPEEIQAAVLEATTEVHDFARDRAFQCITDRYADDSRAKRRKRGLDDEDEWVLRLPTLC